MSKISDIFAKFSIQSDNKNLTITWSNRDSVTEAQDELYDLVLEVIGTNPPDSEWWRYSGELLGQIQARSDAIARLNKAFGKGKS